MALTFTTGTISQADAGSVGLAMLEQIRDDVTAHPAWELVEEYEPGSSAIKYCVLKCLATESGLPSDFFAIIARTKSNGELRFAVAEDYNSGTHTMKYYSETPSTNTYDAEGRATSSYTLGAAQWGGTAGNPHYGHAWNPNAVSSKYWAVAAEDGFTVAFNGTTNTFVHLGAFTPLSILDWPMPIQIISPTIQGNLTRNPAVADLVNPFSYARIVDAGGSTSRLLGFPGSLRYNDKLQDNNRPMAEVAITMSAMPGQSSWAEVYGWAVGKQRRMRATNYDAPPAGFAFGDAFVLNGSLWVPYHPGDSRLWDTGVAAA